MASTPGTQGPEYTERLTALTGVSWKERLDVQAPYRWNLRRLRPGTTLDVGCGIGRNLCHLPTGSVGVDHNPTSVKACTDAGLTALTAEAFHLSEHAAPHRFDTLLLAHVLEHLEESTAHELLTEYLPFIKPAGQVIVITPQERGYATDATHVRFVDSAASAAHLRAAGLDVSRQLSFPFPRLAGKLFPYNEFVVTAAVPEIPASRA